MVNLRQKGYIVHFNPLKFFCYFPIRLSKTSQRNLGKTIMFINKTLLRDESMPSFCLGDGDKSIITASIEIWYKRTYLEFLGAFDYHRDRHNIP